VSGTRSNWESVSQQKTTSGWTGTESNAISPAEWVVRIAVHGYQPPQNGVSSVGCCLSHHA